MNQRDDVGVSATPETIDNYYRLLRSHVIRRWRNYTHERLLLDLRLLTAKNRTERDLSVAWGWTLVQMSGISIKKKRRRGRPDAAAIASRQLPIQVYR